MQKNPPRAFLSNQTEELYEQLKAEIYCSEANPFCKRLIIIPTISLKSYLLPLLASNSPGKISFGLKILSLKSALEKLLSQAIGRKLFAPSLFDWEVAICERVKKLVTDGSQESELKRLALVCLQMDESLSLSLREEQKIIQFSQKIALIFEEWGWEGKKSENGIVNTPFYKFIESLWDELLDEKANWDLPFRLLEENYQQPNFMYQEVHLFGFSYIPKNFYEFFHALSTHLKVRLYLLSPCMMYWADILSDTEASRVQRKAQTKKIPIKEQLALEELLFERNSLLANLGKVGRDFLQTFDGFPHEIEEYYGVSENVLKIFAFQDYLALDSLKKEASKSSLLKCIQTDLLLLLGKRKEKIEIHQSDATIQIHSVKTDLQEIEVLKSTLLQLAQKEPLKAADIIVLAPNISKYQPYIERLFSKETSPFEYQILSSKVEAKPFSVFETFLELLKLPEKRFSKDAIIKLFYCKAFRKKAGLEKDDLQILAKIFRESGFEQAISPSHLSEIFLNEGYNLKLEEDFSSTFKEVEEHLLPNVLGKEAAFSQSEAKAIAKAIFVIKTLFQMHMRADLKRELSFIEWQAYFEELLTTYFQLDYQDEDEKRDFEALNFACLQFGKLQILNSDAKVSFISAKTLLSKMLQKQSGSDTFLQKELIFASIGQLRAHPAKIVCLIGMNEEDFPRRDKTLISATDDFDRYLFLEALLSCRSHILVSFQGFSFADRQEVLPARPVEELISAIDEGYKLEKSIITKHPLYKESPSEKKEEPPFDFFQVKTKKNESQTLELSTLLQVAKSPLQAYLESEYNLRFSKVKNESELFELKDVYEIKKKALFLSDNEFEAILKEHPKIPDGQIKKALHHLLHEERKELEHKKQKLQLSNAKALTIELSGAAKKIEKEDAHYIFPAITLEIDGRQIAIQGKLERHVAKGFLLYEKQDVANLVRVWPEFLIFSHLAETADLQKDTIFFLRDAKKKVIKIKDPLYELTKFTSHALKLSANSFGLYHDSVEDIVKKDKEDFFAELKEKQARDEYLSFFTKRCSDESLKSLWPQMKEKAEFLYGDLIRAWSTKNDEC